MGDELKELRYEKKFVVSEISFHEIENFIKFHPAIFSEIFSERRVNNIYLDSVDLKNYKENLAGNSKRIKIRIRWYGRVFGVVENPILELKIKNNELGKKLSFPLKPFILDGEFSLGLLRKVFLMSDLPDWLVEKLKSYYPSLLNTYKRKYFVSADKKYRITLDKDLVFFKIRERNNSFKERVDGGVYILEIKYLYKDYGNVRNITEHFPFRLSANSKYVKGMDVLEL